MTGDGVALRGGVVDYEFVVYRNTWRLDQTRFTEDVTVSGLVVDDFPTLDAVLTVTGPDGRPRSVHITGDFLTFIAGMTITLAVAGRPATFTVPAY